MLGSARMSTSSSLQGAHVRGVFATRRLRYPVVLPTVGDPRLHLAGIIVTLAWLLHARRGVRYPIWQHAEPV